MFFSTILYPFIDSTKYSLLWYSYGALILLIQDDVNNGLYQLLLGNIPNFTLQ